MPRTLPLLLLATLLTAAFAALAWLGLGVYLVWLPAGFARELAWPWRIALGASLPFPWHASWWQIIALSSLAWTILGARAPDAAWSLERRLLAHMAAIVGMTLALGVAMLVPLVGVASVLH